MPRDYKHRANQGRKRTTLSPWVGVFAGLLIGLFVAFLVYIKSQSEPREPVYEQEILPPPAAAAREEEVPATPKEEPAETPSPPKPRFDFYTLLPEMEVVIPEEEFTENLKQTAPPVAAPAVTAPVVDATPPDQAAPAAAATQRPAAAAAPAAPAAPAAASTGSYFLQVGSFRSGEQAERFKAELGMLGLQTSIQKVTINNTDTYHRVRVGPFGTLDELDRTRQRLKKQGIDSTPIKVRG
jgi:cell division protein FtsN